MVTGSDKMAGMGPMEERNPGDRGTGRYWMDCLL